jgi:hypothetical protein
MPSVEPETAAPLPSERDVPTERERAVLPGVALSKATNSSSTPIDLPLPVYSAIASLALRTQDLAPAETPAGERPFVGYGRERAAYARLRPEFLARDEGRYVVLVGAELEGLIDTFETSAASRLASFRIRAALRQAGRGRGAGCRGRPAGREGRLQRAQSSIDAGVLKASSGVFTLPCANARC